MASFKVNITISSDFTSQELAEFFKALAESERGSILPLMKVLHPVNPPPTVLTPVEEVETPAAAATAESETATTTTASVSQTKNIHWERSNIILASNDLVEQIQQAIMTGEFLSPTNSISWQGEKYSPRSHHNQRIIEALRGAPNRTMSFVSIGAKTGIPDKTKLKLYLREMDKQGIITTSKCSTF